MIVSFTSRPDLRDLSNTQLIFFHPVNLRDQAESRMRACTVLEQRGIVTDMVQVSFLRAQNGRHAYTMHPDVMASVIGHSDVGFRSRGTHPQQV